MQLGCFTTDKKGEIVSLNKAMLKFARRDKKIVKWYGEGSVGENDLICFIGKVPEDESFLNGVIHETNVTTEETILLLSVYGNREYFPLVKVIGKTDGLLADMIYAGEQVHVERSLCSKKIAIMLGDQMVEIDDLSEEGSYLVIKNRKGISYFSPKGSGMAEIEQVLETRMFRPYFAEKLPLKLEEIFDDEVINTVLSLNEAGDKRYLNLSGNQTVIRLRDCGQLQPGEKLFEIGDEEDYLGVLKDSTEIYNRLYFEREIKISHNELGCEARLRGHGKEINKINRQLDKVCHKNVTIVLTGESGTGKTYLARQIHKNGRRADGPFVNVNCASIAYNLIESELFGYESGAFTGARKGGKIGYFEMAEGGTLFLDEITELPLKLQGKLLEVLQEGTFYRVGGTEKISANVRLIVATNRNLEEMVKDGKFREDLYYRINVFPIHLPPLRDRVADMYGIIEDTLPTICERLEIEPLMISQAAMEKLSSYRWPGNIRELENILEKAAVMADENLIREEDIILNNTVAGGQIVRTLKEKVEIYEKETIQSAYEQFNGDRKKMAQFLGLSKTNLFDKIHKYQIENGKQGE